MRSKLSLLVVVTALFCVTSLVGVNQLKACDVGGNFRFEIDKTKTNLPVPKQVNVDWGGEMKRGHEPTDSCADLGFFSMSVTPVEECVGYIFVVVEGDVPDDLFSSPVLPVARSEEGGSFFWYWIDGAQREQEELDFKVIVTPINCAGVKGPPSEPVHIYDPGVSLPEEDDSGCSQTGSRTPASMLWFVALAGVVMWRRRGGWL